MYKQRECKDCGAEFAPRSGTQVYCADCGEKQKRDKACARKHRARKQERDIKQERDTMRKQERNIGEQERNKKEKRAVWTPLERICTSGLSYAVLYIPHQYNPYPCMLGRHE